MNQKSAAKSFSLILALLAVFAFTLAGCGGSGGGTVTGSQDGTVSMMVSDAPANDWATIGVRMVSIALNPSGGGAPVTVFTAPATPPYINLVQLAQLGELLANASVPAGTYTSATLTLSANPGDVILTASEDPDPGFAGTAGATVPSGQIQIQGATGAVGSLTVPLNIGFVSPLVVAANTSNQLDLEFNLEHPAFLIAHVPSVGAVEWAVNFNGPVHHHPIADITHFLLRDLYGTADSISGANETTLTITRDYPIEPPTNAAIVEPTPATPEGEITSSQTLNVLCDSVNGTLFYNLDASPVTPVTLMNFSTLAGSLPGKFVRIAARFQPGGQLVAVRIWASSSFDKVWANPEGRVLHVRTASNQFVVTNEIGGHVTLQVDANTQYFFRVPASALADATPIGTGTAFLANIFRGFKVHVLANPLTVPPTAITVDIQTPRFDGAISLSNLTSFTYTRGFATALDNYVFKAFYASTGFTWWNFSFPTVTDTSISDFISATDGSITFGGAIGAVPAYGESTAIWNDPNNPNGWAVPNAILVPSPYPLGSVSTAFSTGTDTFSMVAPPAPGGTTPVTVDVSVTPGSATLVYAVNRVGGFLTINPVNITTTAGLNTFTNAMINGTLVKIAGVPESTGHLRAYVIFYFTGVAPAS